MSFNPNETKIFWNQFPDGVSLSSLRGRALLSESAQRKFIEDELAKAAETALVAQLPQQAVEFAGELLIRAS